LYFFQRAAPANLKKPTQPELKILAASCEESPIPAMIPPRKQRGYATGIPCSVVTTGDGHGNLGTALRYLFRGFAAVAAAFFNQIFHQKLN